MAAVTPYFDDIRDLTYTVEGTAVVGGTFVEAVPGFDRRCRPAAAGSTTVVGVAAYDAAIGAKVKVFKYQMVPLTAPTGGVTAGAKLISAAAGAVALSGATPDARTVNGQALEDAVAAQVFRAFVF